MAELHTTINGEAIIAEVDPAMSLANFLREKMYLTGTKIGCGKGECGACTVIMDGKAVTSCIIPVMRAEGACIETIEGLADGAKLHPIQESFIEAAEASDIITETADPNANIIWGADIDDEMGDSIRITVIATGFESVSEYEEEASPAPAPAQGVKLPGVNRTGQRTAKQNGLGNSFEDWETGKEVNYTAPRKNRAEYSSPLPEGEEVTPHFTKQDLPRDYDPHERNNLDLPSFLRNQKK